jgi:acyl-CoA synthetase (AMP-forming)/AMP-acid ligase II
MHVLNTAMLLEHAAQTAPARPFLTGSEPLDFAAADRAARRFGNALLSLGITAGERVALLMPNTPAFVTCYYGALTVGAIPVPLHAASPGPEVAFFLEDSGAATLVAAGSNARAALDGFGAWMHRGTPLWTRRRCVSPTCRRWHATSWKALRRGRRIRR